jgi:hypothetical protein
MRFAALLATAAIVEAADPAPAWVTGKAAELEVAARVIADKEAQIQAVGSDLHRQYVIVEVKLTPRGGYPVVVQREDFLLRSARDAERSTAESPDRIAGSSVLVLGATGGGGRGMFSEAGDPVFVGGLPGTGSRPRRIGVDDSTIGNAAGSGETTVTSSQAKVSPLLTALRDKELALGELRKPASGYLYFAVDPKQKTKNFWLHYKGAGGVADLHFR